MWASWPPSIHAPPAWPPVADSGPTSLSIAQLFEEIDLVVFDKDGTLIDFREMWAPWFDELARRLTAAAGANVRDELWRAMADDPASGETLPLGAVAGTTNERMWEITIGVVAEIIGDRARAEDVTAEVWFLPDPVTSARTLADLPALFGNLHDSGRTVGVITADDRLPTERTLAAFGVGAAVDALVCGNDGLPNKPAPDTLLHACSLVGVDPRRAAMIGDMPGDLLMARNAGAGVSIGVLSGAGRREILEPLAHLLLPSIGVIADVFRSDRRALAQPLGEPGPPRS